MPLKLTVSAPGKVILSGEHAVVHGTHAVATVVDRRTFISLDTEVNDNLTSLVMEYRGNRIFHSWTQDALKNFRQEVINEFAKRVGFTATSNDELTSIVMNHINDEDNNLDVLTDILCEMFPSLPLVDHKMCAITSVAEYQPIPEELARGLDTSPAKVFLLYSLFMCAPCVPLNVAIRSDLPMGAGLGSSASLCAAMGGAVYALAHHTLHGVLPESFQPSCLAKINRWAFQGERVIHGNPSGVDNTCVVYGGIIIYRRDAAGKSQVQFLESGCIPSSVELIVSDTRIPKDTKSLVAKVGRNKVAFPAVINPLLQAFDGLALELVAATRAYLAADKATPEATHAATTAWYKIAAALFPMNQCFLDAVGVGHPVISEIIHEADKLGLVTKITGAGGGGSLITLVPPHQDVDAADVMTRGLERVVCGLKGNCIKTVMGQEGVRIEQCSLPTKKRKISETTEGGEEIISNFLRS